ncbi:hypothetical protein A3F23_04215 [Candidatus Giovannonibacteria bacterium RIFCSPHIGHO2_12_FULL_43_15]|uniref:Uncharacterized protein n=1 Tax=Candidatus Giovannonibacteria bacterium RIFCSPHIGHO2_12_FULL_43_15 TaxID=1798341 RepID=A0A1F5WQP3_9BACT|nr:MAG: hypothetical protein A3F23_04215 [Candidatus Giovannonibacteria bacterium RIFCSPHIGHO2_12_FULL_43_15]
MALSWVFRKQLKIFIFLAIVVFAIVGGIIYYFQPAPSCMDQKLNQHEERVDCGGECEACVIDPKDLVVSWARPFELTSGNYDVAALVENPNLYYGSREIEYTFLLYANNILIGSRDGKTFLNPREKFMIFESGISSKERVATRATIEFKEIKWKKFGKERANILVSSKDFKNVPNGRAEVVLKNQTLFPIKNVYVAVALTDPLGNAVGVSATKVDEIPAEDSKDIYFTWRAPIGFASSTEVYLRTNLTE